MNFASCVPGQTTLREYAGAELGDRRLSARLDSLVLDLSRFPAKSLPKQLKSVAKREAAYRFFANEAVDVAAVLAPHKAATFKRIEESKVVRIVHDTCRFAFEGDRDGLEILENQTRGFFGHFALAVGGDEEREPLGVVGLRTHMHDGEALARRRKLTKRERDAESLRKPRIDKVNHRWERLACDVAEALPKRARAVHVMDMEADDYAVFSTLLERRIPFVIRGESRRRTENGEVLRDLLAATPHHAFRDVRLNRRPQRRKGGKKLIPRDERTADLRIRFLSTTVRPSPTVVPTVSLKLAPLNVVHVFEPNPPEGEPAVEWILLTSESVTTVEEALAVVDHYRARWLIEEYFKALKSGCSFEKRQLTSYDGLTRLLGVFIPIAWQLLRLRYLSRRPAPVPADKVMDATQLKILRALLQAEGCDFKLPKEPTSRDVLFAVAALGGHIRNNGDPGWIVIGRGFEDFLAAERVWRLAQAEM